MRVAKLSPTIVTDAYLHVHMCMDMRQAKALSGC